MSELTPKDLKCKNHIYISDYSEKSIGVWYLIHLPKILLHQVICPDNPVLHAKEQENYEKYDKHIGEGVRDRYKVAEEMVLRIHQKKTELKAIIGI